METLKNYLDKTMTEIRFKEDDFNNGRYDAYWDIERRLRANEFASQNGLDFYTQEVDRLRDYSDALHDKNNQLKEEIARLSKSIDEGFPSMLKTIEQQTNRITHLENDLYTVRDNNFVYQDQIRALQNNNTAWAKQFDDRGDQITKLNFELHEARTNSWHKSWIDLITTEAKVVDRGKALQKIQDVLNEIEIG